MTTTQQQLQTPTDLHLNAIRKVADVLNAVLADSLALFLKTKNFHWHVSGPHFRDYHLMLDDQVAQILGTTDQIAERIRKTGNTTLRSIGDVARRQRIKDNDAEFVSAKDMLRELRQDNLIDVPTLILHGDDDQIVPIGASALLSAKLVKNAKLKVYPQGSHGICQTQQDEVNADLLTFIQN